MSCSDCKKKKEVIVAPAKTKSSSIDKWGGWIIFIWFLLGCYGLFSLIKDIFFK